MSPRFYIQLARFYAFQSQINKQTWQNQKLLRSWAYQKYLERKKTETKDAFLNSDRKIVREGYELRQALAKKFKNKYKNVSKIKILVHCPPSYLSPGGYSLFNNLIQGLQYIGVETVAFWNEPTAELLKKHKPTVLLSSDAREYKNLLDFSAIQHYRKKHSLAIGLTASLAEYGNTPLVERLNWAKQNAISFFYSFRSPDYFTTRKEYAPFFESNFSILTVEFGANPLFYYPLPDIEPDLPYIFLASSNSDKWSRYFSYLPPIVNAYPGIIDGPGWLMVKEWLPPFLHRYAYAKAMVGINLHIPDSLDWPSELNERTYILAASGVPQLVDRPKLLNKRFSPDAVFVADSPKEYLDLFRYIVQDRDEAERRAQKAQLEVLTRHTSFHRAESFLRQLERTLHEQ